MKKIILIVLALFGCLVSAQNQSKKEKIIELINITNSIKNSEQVKDQFLGTYAKQFPQLSKEFWQTAGKKLDVTQLYQEKIIPIYDKYYTEQELDAAIKFYKSPLGSSIIRKQPQILQESMEAGKQWGKEIGESLQNLVRKELEQDKYLSPPPPAR